jgi:hypothetical protein
MDDAELDSMPTRVIKPEERAALPAPKPASARLPPIPASVAESHLPPPPRPATFRRRMPTEPSSYRIAQGQPPPSVGSVPPVALSQPPPPVELPMRRMPRGLVAAASVAAAALLAVGLLGAKGAIFASHGNGSLVATVAGAQGQPVKGLAVFVDGAQRCESSPCRVEELDSGSHFVKVTAPGYIPTAAQAVAVHSGQDAVMRLELSPLKSAKADQQVAKDDSAKDKPAPADNAKPDDDGAVQASNLPAAPTQAASRAPVYHHAVARHAAAPVHNSAPAAKPAPPAAPAGKGILVLSSTPATNVVVDGHPLGSTPKAVRVDAGTHTVVFAGEAGRAVRAITVKPDDHLNVAVRF